MTRKLVFEMERVEGMVRVHCRTKVVHMTSQDLGYYVTEFLYRAGILPPDPRPEPSDDYEEA